MLLNKLKEQDSWDLFHFVSKSIAIRLYFFSFCNDINIKILYNISTKVIFVKVIFLKDLKKQGKKNEIKEVSDGYATNYLIKNGYAVKYTKSSSERLDTEITQNKINEENNIRIATEIKNKLEKEVISFNVSTGKDGKVFGSISSKQIYEELNKRGYKVDKKQIVITDSLSYIVMFYVDVVLHKKVICKLRVELKSK